MVIAFCSRAAVTVFQQAVKSFERNRKNETYIIAESIDHCKHQIVSYEWSHCRAWYPLDKLSLDIYLALPPQTLVCKYVIQALPHEGC